jgi:hypothetical protein
MLKTEELAQEDPDVVREFAEKCDDPLRSKLLDIANSAEGES